MLETVKKEHFLLKSKELIFNFTAKILTRCSPEWIMLINSLPPLKNYQTCMLILWILCYINIILDILNTMSISWLLPLESPLTIFSHRSMNWMLGTVRDQWDMQWAGDDPAVSFDPSWVSFSPFLGIWLWEWNRLEFKPYNFNILKKMSRISGHQCSQGCPNIKLVEKDSENAYAKY